MISSYFKKGTTSSSTTPSSTSSSSTPSSNEPPVKKPKKRNTPDGFGPKTTPNKIKFMKSRTESGSWRHFQKIKVAHTLIYKDWQYDSAEFRELILVPFGMVNSLLLLHNNLKKICDWKSLKQSIKDELGLDANTYDKSKLKLTSGHMGNLGEIEFDHVVCSKCIKTVLPIVLEKYKHKLPQSSDIKELMCNWDAINVSSIYFDVVGCLLPNEEHVQAGPNARRFIVRPTEHNLHDKIVLKNNPSGSNPSSESSTLSSLPPTSSNQSIITSKGPVREMTTKKVESSDIVTVRGKKADIHLVSIDALLDPHINLKTPSSKPVDIWAKEFLLSTIHTGCKKLISNEASLDFYTAVTEGVRGYHSTVLKDIEINKKKIPPPPRVLVDRNNVDIPQKALLTSFQLSTAEKNPYNILKSNDLYSFMHDGIQKFGRELNGVFTRTLSLDMEVLNVPWSLSEIEGGSLNSEKLVTHVFEVIKSVKPIINSADKDVSRILLQTIEPTDFPKPPKYFEVCTLLHFSVESKVINLCMMFWPVAIVADGCSTNSCASGKLVSRYGFVSPSMRCSSHAADGSLKRLANSKTMNVEEVTEFLPFFRKIMKHFSLSGKSTSALNEDLTVLGMKKVHIMSYCQTRMAYLLSACSLAIDVLVSICNVLVSLDLKKEQRDYFLSPKCMFIMHILADVAVPFKKTFLKCLDSDDGTIIDTFRINMEYINHLETAIEFPKLKKFVENLQFDEYGNLSVHVTVQDNVHDINLNYTHHPSRKTDNRLQKLKDESNALRGKVVCNLISNVKEQSQAGSVVEFASAFDMHRKIDLDERLVLVKQLGDIYCTDYVHNVDFKEGDASFWDEYVISIKYPKKIDCTTDELLKEMRNIWPACNKVWLKFRDDKKDGNYKFWQHMCSLYTVSHPNVCSLLNIILTISPNTGPLERSYSKLAKLCYKDRNKLTTEHMEVQYLLSQLNDYSFDYNAARLIMENDL